MKYLVGFIGLVAVFAAYTSIMLVRFTEVQAAQMDFEHQAMLCLTGNFDEQRCGEARYTKDVLDRTAAAIGKAPKFYRLFLPNEVLKTRND